MCWLSSFANDPPADSNSTNAHTVIVFMLVHTLFRAFGLRDAGRGTRARALGYFQIPVRLHAPRRFWYATNCTLAFESIVIPFTVPVIVVVAGAAGDLSVAL